MRERLQRLAGMDHRVVRDSAVLLSGTALAYVGAAVGAPLVARAFPPAAFGYLSLFLGAVSILSIVGSGRYENAVLIAKRESQAFALLGASAGIACVLAAFLSVGVAARGSLSELPRLNGQMRSVVLQSFWILLPIAVAIVSLQQPLNSWHYRRGRVSLVSLTRALRAVVTVAVLLILGLGGGTAWSLVLGNVVGQSAAILVLTMVALHDMRSAGWAFRWRRVKAVGKRYASFPALTTVSGLLSAISAQLPIYAVSAIASPATLGLFSLSRRAALAPAALLGPTVGDALRSSASHHSLTEKKRKELFLFVGLRLAVVGVPIAGALYFMGPALFAAVLGEAWRPAGELARLLWPMAIMAPIASPLSGLLLIRERQGWDLSWQVALIAAISAVFLVAGPASPIESTLATYARVVALLYVISLALSWEALLDRRRP
jgi:O-antigen/teichoic acid export membrane protein